MSAAATDREAHRAFLNRYYGAARHVYDATRRWYLFGRDRALEALLSEPWERLVEIGSGTGRNLRMLADARPTARLGGVDACDEMIAHARRRCPTATFVRGFAEEVDLTSLLGARPDRILFSYSLSMIQEPEAALDRALAALAPGGKVVVVDFGDFATMPAPFRRGLRRWLDAFHVTPLSSIPGDVVYGPGRYYVVGMVAGSR